MLRVFKIRVLRRIFGPRIGKVVGTVGDGIMSFMTCSSHQGLG
jgi:hypothetical protein